MKIFSTPSGRITIDPDTFNGNPEITIINENEEMIASLMVDNYQVYKIAMYLMSLIEVDDNRGAK